MTTQPPTSETAAEIQDAAMAADRKAAYDRTIDRVRLKMHINGYRQASVDAESAIAAVNRSRAELYKLFSGYIGQLLPITGRFRGCLYNDNGSWILNRPKQDHLQAEHNVLPPSQYRMCELREGAICVAIDGQEEQVRYLMTFEDVQITADMEFAAQPHYTGPTEI